MSQNNQTQRVKSYDLRKMEKIMVSTPISKGYDGREITQVRTLVCCENCYTKINIVIIIISAE